MPQNWEGPVKLIETAKGSNVYTIKPHKGGKYTAEDVPAIIKALLAAKVSLDGWKAWIDEDSGFDVKLEKGEHLTPAKLAKLVRQADSIQLAFVKRPWAQPKLYFTKGEVSSRKANKSSDLREL